MGGGGEGDREKEKILTFLEGHLVIISSSVVIDSNVARSTRRWRGWGLLLLWWGDLRSSCKGKIENVVKFHQSTV